MSHPLLTRERTPKFVDKYWQGPARIATLVEEAASPLVAAAAVVLPLTRLSGSLVFPVLNGLQIEARRHDPESQLDVVLVSVSPPKRALKDLLQLRAYGHCIVLLSPAYRKQYFDLAELDLRGIGVVQGQTDGSTVQLVASEGIPVGAGMAPWWRRTRERQLLVLAGRQ